MDMRPEDQIYYAHRLRCAYSIAYFHACPREWWVRLNGMEDCPVVRIRLRERREEDPLPVERTEPDYHGWLPTGWDEYKFIWPSRAQVDMCFPYGVKAEEERGAGRLVRLVATEIAEGLNIDPPFQRAHVWTEAQQIAYLEYLLRGGEVSRLIVVNAPHWQDSDYQGSTLVDGKQRLEAVRRFMRSELPVFGGHVLRDIRGHLRLFNGRLKWRVVALESEAELLDLYLAINAGGTPHSPDEIAKVRAMRERLAP